MYAFNTIDEDPYVSILFDEIKIVDFFADHKAYDKLRKMEEGIKSPSRPSNLIYVDFFFDDNRKVIFLLMADNKALGLKFPQTTARKVHKIGKMVLISATSSKALIKFFSQCARRDLPQQAVYLNIQHFLNGAFMRSEIPVK